MSLWTVYKIFVVLHCQHGLTRDGVNLIGAGLSISHVRRPGLSNLAPGLASSALNKSSGLAVHISATSGPRIKYDLSIHIYIFKVILYKKEEFD